VLGGIGGIGGNKPGPLPPAPKRPPSARALDDLLHFTLG